MIKNLPDFRLVFVDAPFLSASGPGVVPVYENWGPFRRWLRWRPEHPEIDDEDAAEMILSSLERCKLEDEGDGPWVGLLGFSQGAKIAASILYDQQIRAGRGFRDSRIRTNYRFAVLFAGRGPLISFCENGATPLPGFATAGQMSTTERSDYYPGQLPNVLLRFPTIHVHGLNDMGLHWHRKLLKQYHDSTTTTVIEWDGTHRMPLKRADVMKVVLEIYRVAREEGVDI